MEVKKVNHVRPSGTVEKLEQKQSQSKKNAEEFKRVYLVKLLTLLALAGFLITFTTIAWFTMNKETGTGGMGVLAASDLFSVEAVSAPGYHVGIYDDSTKSGTYVRDVLFDRSGKNMDVITWTITDDVAVTDASGTTTVTKGKNIGNGPAQGFEGGINPGSSGEIQFVVRPNRPVDTRFTFYVYAYTGGYDEHGDLDKTRIQLVGSDSSPDSLIAQKLLNGHILLFSEQDSNGKYSGLISSDSDFYRLMEESYSTQTTVSIYWVWPETLAEIILDDNTQEHARNLRGKRSLCSAEARGEIIGLFKTNPSWFLLNPENGSYDWSGTFNSNVSDADIVNVINTNYALYSSYYNEADQCIGTYISYILLDMSAEGTASAGS